MGKSKKTGVSNSTRANSRHSREQRDRDFRQRFGHPYRKSAYHGHLFYGWNCSECGIHISLVAPGGWPQSKKHGEYPYLKSISPNQPSIRVGRGRGEEAAHA
jgi:hypothetical protein